MQWFGSFCPDLRENFVLGIDHDRRGETGFWIWIYRKRSNDKTDATTCLRNCSFSPGKCHFFRKRNSNPEPVFGRSIRKINNNKTLYWILYE